MAVTPYPLGFPGESVQALINLLMAGEFLEKKDLVGLHVWNIQGYAMGTLLGYPETPISKAVPQADPGTCEAVIASRDLTRLVELLEQQGEQPRAATSVFDFDLWGLVDLLLKLLELIRERSKFNEQ